MRNSTCSAQLRYSHSPELKPNTDHNNAKPYLTIEPDPAHTISNRRQIEQIHQQFFLDYRNTPSSEDDTLIAQRWNCYNVYKVVMPNSIQTSSEPTGLERGLRYTM